MASCWIFVTAVCLDVFLAFGAKVGIRKGGEIVAAFAHDFCRDLLGEIEPGRLFRFAAPDRVRAFVTTNGIFVVNGPVKHADRDGRENMLDFDPHADTAFPTSAALSAR